MIARFSQQSHLKQRDRILSHPQKSLLRRIWKKPAFLTTFFAVLLLFIPIGYSQVLTLDFAGSGGSMSGQILQLIALLTVLSLAPSILIMVTSFTRIIIVFSFLRSALGLQQSPPNTVLVSLALFLTAYIMMPVMNDAYDNGIKPYMDEEISEMEGFDKATKPFKEFMLKNVREKDLLLFIDMGGTGMPENQDNVSLQALIPAFMISELKRAFEIGFMLFLPFLIIDIVTASVLMSMGMMMVPPIMISLPFKVIFFVLVDGWYLVVGSLAQSYVS